MRSALRGPAHQLAVRMRINNCIWPAKIIIAQSTSQPCASNCVYAEGLHFSAFHFILVHVSDFMAVQMNIQRLIIIL